MKIISEKLVLSESVLINASASTIFQNQMQKKFKLKEVQIVGGTHYFVSNFKAENTIDFEIGFDDSTKFSKCALVVEIENGKVSILQNGMTRFINEDFLNKLYKNCLELAKLKYAKSPSKGGN